MTNRPVQGGPAIPVSIIGIDPGGEPGAPGSAPGSSMDNVLPVDIRGVTLAVPNTIFMTTAGAYTTGQYVGSSGVALVFLGMARLPGGGGILTPAQVVDKNAVGVAGELWLFDTPVTPPADKAAWTLTDADMLHRIATLSFSNYYASAANSVSDSINPAIQYKCAAGNTSLYGCWVTRGSVTYASNDLTVTVKGLPD